MFFSDFILALNWWFIFLISGLIFFPLTSVIFGKFKDKGYIFSKVISLIFVSYSAFIITFLHLMKFSFTQIAVIIFIFILLNIFVIWKFNLNIVQSLRKNYKLIIAEEFVFLITLLFWTYVRGNLSDIHGLEKFMDFGFINSILRSDYFPPKDMWYTPLSINYYYFGHLATSVFIKISNIPSPVGYNLMLASTFAFAFTCTVSLSINIFDNIKKSLKSSLAGFLSAVLLSLGGNLVTIYTFFKPYQNENPVPFWQLLFSPLTFPNNFWYPNATRFIPFTIHEFPLYSFVVSDLHGHVLDIPFVLMAIGLLFSLFISQKIKNINLILISFVLAILYMTNAWDGLIYMLLTLIIFTFINFYKKENSFSFKSLVNFALGIFSLIIGFFIFSLPFSLNFKPFVSGIGIICAPKFLTNLEKIGPFLFEPDHCLRSPLWQLIILYGFFYFCVISFALFIKFKRKYVLTKGDIFIIFLISLSTLLILIPEFIYVKDIYPAHYRANTMFKLTYEAFIMLSVSAGYIIAKIITSSINKIFLSVFILFTIILIYLVLSYPVFAINSYYNDLKQYKGIDGTNYLKTLYSADYDLINWFNKNVTGQPVILEANGDSYTDYGRISANTGLPTIIGWPVHEWLWRGSYDVAAPRIEDVKTLYESPDLNLTKTLIKKYNIAYVVISNLEFQKYTNLNENKFKNLGNVIFQSGNSKVIKINF